MEKNNDLISLFEVSSRLVSHVIANVKGKGYIVGTNLQVIPSQC